MGINGNIFKKVKNYIIDIIQCKRQKQQTKMGYYSTDIWAIIADRIKDKIAPGITLYAEICGQMNNGSWVQKDFDYGIPSFNIDYFIFRITYTNILGQVFEFSTPQIQDYCKINGLNTAPVFYYGYAKDYISKDGLQANIENHWQENFLELLIKDFTEKDCFMCKNKLPEEGVVLRVENSNNFNAYKLKSIRFLERETSLLDKGEENIEDNS